MTYQEYQAIIDITTKLQALGATLTAEQLLAKEEAITYIDNADTTKNQFLTVVAERRGKAFDASEQAIAQSFSDRKIDEIIGLMEKYNDPDYPDTNKNMRMALICNELEIEFRANIAGYTTPVAHQVHQAAATATAATVILRRDTVGRDGPSCCTIM
jgi:hypothetical protein